MKPLVTSFSRRHFIAAAGASALAAKVSAAAVAVHSPSGYAFAGSDGELRVYSTGQNGWTQTQAIASKAPVSLVTDPVTNTLHVLHQVAEHERLPRGYIESFRIDRRTGQLQLLSTQPLSLSAIYPGHMALSPNGKALAVAVYGGSAYNLLPVLKDGRPDRPIGIRKETGLSSDSPSRPSYIGFNSSSNRIFALDEGTATLSALAAQPELPVISRLRLPYGGKLSHFSMHPDENLIFLIDESSQSLFTISCNPANAELTLGPRIFKEPFLGPLTIQSSSRTVFAAAVDFLHAYRIKEETGELQLIQRLSYPGPSIKIRGLFLDNPRNLLHATTDDAIYRSRIDFRDGTLSQLVPVAYKARGIAFL